MTMSRPIDDFRVTSDTAEHAARGVGPATDYAAPGAALPIGTPVRAPFPVSDFLRWGSDEHIGGFALNATSPEGRFTFVAQHLSRYADVRGLVLEGEVIAFSGNSGKFTTGPHLHCYVIADGVRMSMEEAIEKFGLSGAQKIQEDDMFTDEDRELLKRVDSAIRLGKAGSHTDGSVTRLIKSVQRKVGALDPEELNEAAIGELAAELKATLPAATAKALAKILDS